MKHTTKPPSNIELLLSYARGRYIPRDFIEGFDTTEWNIGEDDIKNCSDPSNEYYWDAWRKICDTARYTAADGRVYSLYQDGNLWAVCYDSMTDKEIQDFFGKE